MELVMIAVLAAGVLVVLARLSARVSALERDTTRLHATWQGLVLSDSTPAGGPGAGLEAMADPFEVLQQLPEGMAATPARWRLVLVVDPDCTACATVMRSYSTRAVPAGLGAGYGLVIASTDCALPPAWRAHFPDAAVLCGEALGVLARLVPPAALVLDPAGTVRGVTELSGFDELVSFLEDGASRGIGPPADEAAAPREAG